MTKGLYINENTFLSFAELKRDKLTEEMASREAAWDFSGIMGLLPEVDPVLDRIGAGVEVLESLEADGHLTSIIQSRKAGIKKLEIKWETAEGDSERGLQLFTEDLASINLRDVVDSILNAPLYGMAPLELIWSPSKDGRIVLGDIKAKPARWFGFDSETGEPRFKSFNDFFYGEELPWGKFVIARNQPTYDAPSGKKLLSRCFWPVTFKKGGLKFWVSFLEKYGSPFLLGHYPTGANEPEQEKMLSSLVQMVCTAAAVVPQGANVELLNAKGASGTSGHKEFVDAMNAEMSKIILGQTLTTEQGNKGSQALGNVHKEVLGDYQDDDKSLVLETLTKIARIWAEVNGLSAPIPSFFEEDDAKTDFAERDSKLESGGRVRFTKKYYMERYNLKEDDIEVVEKAAPVEEKAKDFAESDSMVDLWNIENQIEQAEKAQDLLDQSMNSLILDGVDLLARIKGDVRAWLTGFESIDDAEKNILSLFSQLQSSDFASSIFKGLLTADRLGRGSIPPSQEFAEYGFGKPFTEALDFFQAKSFTIAGVFQADLIGAIKDELVKGMEQGLSMADFRAGVDDLFYRRGLDSLHPYRIDTVFRTNMQSAFMAGRYSQMTDPHILKNRPYWKYVAMDDGRTRPAHFRMRNRIFHYDNPIWQRWYPPNGFNCRCYVVCLSQREIERDGLEIEERDLSYEPFTDIDSGTGEIRTFQLHPDKGFGGATRLSDALGAVYDPPLRQTASNVMQPDIGARSFTKAKTGTSITTLESMGVSSAEAHDLVEKSFRTSLALSPNETVSALKTVTAEAVIIDIGGVAASMSDGLINETMIPLMRRTIEDPHFILRAEFTTATGKSRYRNKYVGLFEIDGEKIALVATQQNAHHTRWQYFDNLQQAKACMQVIYQKR